MPAAFCAGRHWNRAKVVDVEVATVLAGKHQSRTAARYELVERVEGARLQRDCSHARLRLRELELPAREGAANVDNALPAIDVALLECDPLRRPQPVAAGRS